MFLVQIVDDEALAELRTALATDPNDDDVRMMTWPHYAFELVDGHAGRLATVGYIAGGWIRCEQTSDQPLTNPYAVEHWLDRWLPAELGQS